MTRTAQADDGFHDRMYLALQEVKAQMHAVAAQLRDRGLLVDGSAPAPQRVTPAMLVLRPGDKVLLALVEDPTQAEAKTLANALRGSFPGVDFTVVGGIAGIAVQS